MVYLLVRVTLKLNLLAVVFMRPIREEGKQAGKVHGKMSFSVATNGPKAHSTTVDCVLNPLVSNCGDFPLRVPIRERATRQDKGQGLIKVEGGWVPLSGQTLATGLQFSVAPATEQMASHSRP